MQNVAKSTRPAMLALKSASGAYERIVTFKPSTSTVEVIENSVDNTAGGQWVGRCHRKVLPIDIAREHYRQLKAKGYR